VEGQLLAKDLISGSVEARPTGWVPWRYVIVSFSTTTVASSPRRDGATAARVGASSAPTTPRQGISMKVRLFVLDHDSADVPSCTTA